jgi:hypothetical protein
MTQYDTELGVDEFGGFDDEAQVVSLSAPKRRSVVRVVAGAGAIVFAALVGAYAYAAASPETTQVMVADGDLAVGEPISASDMRTVEVGAENGLDSVSPEDQDSLIGLAPRTPVPDGTVLNAGFFVTVEEAIPVGKVIVGAVLDPGASPTDNLRDGDPVGLIAVESGSTDAEPRLIGTGEVWAIGALGDSSDEVWVSVLVDEALQVDVAQAAATGRLWVSAVRS